MPSSTDHGSLVVSSNLTSTLKTLFKEEWISSCQESDKSLSLGPQRLLRTTRYALSAWTPSTFPLLLYPSIISAISRLHLLYAVRLNLLVPAIIFHFFSTSSFRTFVEGRAACITDVIDRIINNSFFSFFFPITFLLSSSTRRRFYPQRSSGQAVVTGVIPSSSPVRAFNFYHA